MGLPTRAGFAAPTAGMLQRMAAAWNGRAGGVAAGCAWLLTVFWCVLRFIALDVSPPGFFMDEALAALHLQCLAETGRSAHGEAWPLFAEGLNGGFYTPAFLYSGLIWKALFGSSVASMRGIAAAYSVATVVGLWMLARELGDEASARWVALAAAISPWAFQFSRVAWDPPLAPAFLVWGAWALVRSYGIAAGLLCSLAMYSYPPLRVQAPLVLLLSLLWLRRRLSPLSILACCVSFAGASVPLVVRSLDPRFMSRTAHLLILTPDYVRERGGERPILFVVSQLLDNLHEHLRPSFLFLTGDSSLRHSSQIIGQLSALDDLALVGLVGLIVKRFVTTESPAAARPARVSIVIGSAIAGLCGVLPAALTCDGLPHALRAIGAWPAVALCTGTVLGALAARYRWAPWLIVMLAGWQTLYVVPRYFTDYRERARGEFQAELRTAAESHQMPQLMAAGRAKHEDQLRYFLIQELGYGCESSREPAARIRRGLPLAP
ncbi:MAG: hypothetical protein ABW321_24505 [Polyangiales bacterium]